MTGRLQGRIAVVTGASRGIGYQTAKAYAAEGAHVIAVARTVGALEELDDEIKAGGGSATLVPFDLKDSAAIDRLGAAIYERWGKLDVLLANAGILGQSSPLGHIPPKVWDEVMAVNVTANWRLIRSLDPLLQRSESGRAIFLSSNIGISCPPFLGPYAVSKAAVEALAKTYSAETRSTDLKVIVVSPGAMRTAMRAQFMPGEDPDSLPRPAEIVPYLIDMAAQDFALSHVRFDFPTKSYTPYPD